MLFPLKIIEIIRSVANVFSNIKYVLSGILSQKLEAQVAEVAQITGVPVSEVIRDAIQRRCDEILAGRLDRRLADVIGIATVGGSSRKTGRTFTNLL